ncbi:hypothetical protein Pelo_15560 [Pelomyxa schiedti]|nr:hypothetical protein Pelo_15560 [Pelomyxa schiedti]
MCLVTHTTLLPRGNTPSTSTNISTRTRTGTATSTITTDTTAAQPPTNAPLPPSVAVGGSKVVPQPQTGADPTGPKVAPQSIVGDPPAPPSVGAPGTAPPITANNPNYQHSTAPAKTATPTSRRREAPMGPVFKTEEELERERNRVRVVYDPLTGRNRTVRGDGEIIETIVSREEQLALRKMASSKPWIGF